MGCVRDRPDGLESLSGPGKPGLNFKAKRLRYPLLSANLQTNMKIAVYEADGRHAGFRTLESAQRLINAGNFKAEYNRKKVIVALHRVGSIRVTANMGQAYSFQESLPDGHRAWRHKSMPRNESRADLFMRDVFRAVPLSCMVTYAPNARW